MKRLISLLLIACAGCISQAVPKTKITGTLNGQPYSFECPKNVTLNGFEVMADSTNKVTVKIQSLVSVMDPQVITTTADGQTKLIQGAISSTADAIGRIAGAVAGKP